MPGELPAHAGQHGLRQGHDENPLGEFEQALAIIEPGDAPSWSSEGEQPVTTH